MRPLIIALILFISAALSLKAQDSDILYRVYSPLSVWSSFRADYYLNTKSFFYAEGNLRFSERFPIGFNFPLNKIHRMYLMGGYQHRASEKWYMGFSAKVVGIRNRVSIFSAVNILHQGKIGSVDFIKQLTLEHLNHPPSDNPNVIVQNEGRASIQALLHKQIDFNEEKHLKFLLSYRIFQIFDLVSDGFSMYDTRRFDKTRLRLDIYYPLTEKIYAGIFALRETDYFYRNVTPEGKLNFVYPVLGITLNYIFNPENRENILPGMPPH